MGCFGGGALEGEGGWCFLGVLRGWSNGSDDEWMDFAVRNTYNQKRIADCK
jgi:hypothetical protein